MLQNKEIKPDHLKRSGKKFIFWKKAPNRRQFVRALFVIEKALFNSVGQRSTGQVLIQWQEGTTVKEDTSKIKGLWFLTDFYVYKAIYMKGQSVFSFTDCVLPICAGRLEKPEQGKK